MIHGCQTHGQVNTFLRAEGPETKNIILTNNNLSLVKETLSLAKDVSKDQIHASNPWTN
jgi:hypothetical protein